MIRSTKNHDEVKGGRLSGPAAAQKTRTQLEALAGCVCEAVSGLARTESGWRVTIEVLELERIPRTTDLLASYVVEIDGRGELVGYERIARYCRGQALDS